MNTALLVAACGAVGSLLRWALAQTVQKLSAESFPLGTLLVNVLGSAAIGLVMAYFATRGQLDSRWRVALSAGFLGGFTTYRSFAYETWALIERRAWALAVINSTVTLLVCFGACAGGVLLGRWLAR